MKDDVFELNSVLEIQMFPKFLYIFNIFLICIISYNHQNEKKVLDPLISYLKKVLTNFISSTIKLPGSHLSTADVKYPFNNKMISIFEAFNVSQSSQKIP